MDSRYATKHRRMTYNFAFSGLISCAKYGSSVIGEGAKRNIGVVGEVEVIRHHHTALATNKKGLATPAGLEPATCGLEDRCSIRLSYGVANQDVNESKERGGRL